MTQVGFATETQILSWEDYQQQLLQKNNILQSSRWTVTASALARDAVGAAAWPTLSLSSSGTHSDASGLTSDLFAYSLSASYTLFDGGAVAARIHAASIALDSAQLNEINSWVSIRTNAHLAYIDAAYYEAQMKLLLKILERLKQNEDFMRVNFEGGHQPRWQYLNAKNTRMSTEQQIDAAKRRLQQARKQMALYLGQSDLEPKIPLQPLVATFDVSLTPNFQSFVSNNINVLLAQKNIENYEAQRDLQRASLWPLITLKGSAGLSGTPAFFPTQDLWSAGLNLSLNLFDANARGNNIAQTEAQVLAAKISWMQTVLESQQGILTALNNVIDQKENLPVAIDALSVAQEQFETTQQLYLSGLAIYLEWQQAQQNLTQTQLSVLNTQYQLNRTVTLLEQALQLR